MIDLHGLHIAEAKELLRELIPELHKHGLRRVRIVTGTGHHSAGTQQEGRMFAHTRHLVEQELGFNTQGIRDQRGYLGAIEVRL
jgi:DNA-nicking Smr family endonuclease